MTKGKVERISEGTAAQGRPWVRRFVSIRGTAGGQGCLPRFLVPKLGGASDSPTGLINTECCPPPAQTHTHYPRFSFSPSGVEAQDVHFHQVSR